MATDWKPALAEIFRETFEGVAPGADGTWYVQGKEAIFDAIRTLNADEASVQIPGQRATIGAHVWHLNYYLTLFNANCRGEEPAADWEGSWRHQEFGDASWTALATDVEAQFKEAKAWYDSGAEPKSPIHAIYAVGNVAHAAYHLGAIRALIGMVCNSHPLESKAAIG